MSSEPYRYAPRSLTFKRWLAWGLLSSPFIIGICVALFLPVPLFVQVMIWGCVGWVAKELVT